MDNITEIGNNGMESGILPEKPTKNPNLKPPWTTENQPQGRGRPKGSVSLVRLMRLMVSAGTREPEDTKKKLRETFGVDADEMISNAHLYMAKVHDAAINGEEWAIKIMLNYIDGMPKQTMDIGGQSDNPIKSEYNFTGIPADELRKIRDILRAAKQSANPE